MSKRLYFIFSALFLAIVLAASFSTAYYYGNNYGYGNSYTYTKSVSSSPYGSTTNIVRQSPGYSYEYRSTKNYGYSAYPNSLSGYWNSGPYPNWNYYQYPAYSDTYVRKTYNTGYYDYYYKPRYDYNRNSYVYSYAGNYGYW